MTGTAARDALERLDIIDSRAAFSRAHLVKTLLLLDERPLGRNRLIQELGLGEASVRTLLDTLEDAGFVEPSTKGHVLTTDGADVVQALLHKISRPVRLDSTDLTVADCDVAIRIRGAAADIGAGIEQRDAGIKAGARGVTTLVYTDEAFRIVGEPADVSEQVANAFDVQDGDVVLIGTADDTVTAEIGVLSASFTVL